MKRDLLRALRAWLDAGADGMGQVAVRPLPGGGWELRHVADLGRDDLEEHTAPEAARHLALADEAGAFRPLKTAPNLRRGWRLRVSDLPALRQALDGFYPAMLGVLRDGQAGALPVSPLRALLGRQTGMYAVTRKLTDAEAQATVAGFCRSDGGCLKTILWPIAPGEPVTSLPPEKFDPAHPQPGTPGRSLPMLCQEGCNLLVAKAREVVKAR